METSTTNKKEYLTPELINYGKLVELTQQNISGGVSDEGCSELDCPEP